MAKIILDKDFKGKDKLLKKLKQQRNANNKNKKYEPLYIGTQIPHKSKKDYDRKRYKNPKNWD
jgi:hypothetical protein